MTYSYKVKTLNKTKKLPKRISLEIKRGNKVERYIFEEWQARELISILDNQI